MIGLDPQYLLFALPGQPHATRVLRAAFLTYLAAAVSSILTLIYYLLRAGSFDRER